jgi:hypothetical protein
MDEIVKLALSKWPNVPHCTGWLRLDQRGAWRLRDQPTQDAGGPGDPLRHEALIGFINRNYEVDATGQWYFQNGPQRVYVELEYTPWVVRLHYHAGRLALTDQTQGDFLPVRCLLDENGAVLFVDTNAPPRIAVMHDHDLDLFADHVSFTESGEPRLLTWNEGVTLPIEAVLSGRLGAAFGFEPSPAQRAAAVAAVAAAANTARTATVATTSSDKSNRSEPPLPDSPENKSKGTTP